MFLSIYLQNNTYSLTCPFPPITLTAITTALCFYFHFAPSFACKYTTYIWQNYHLVPLRSITNVRVEQATSCASRSRWIKTKCYVHCYCTSIISLVNHYSWKVQSRNCKIMKWGNSLVLVSNHIYTSSAGQKSPENCTHGTSLLLFTTTFCHFLRSSPSNCHFIFNFRETFLSHLWHTLFSRKCVASKVHLSAWHTVHHSWLWLTRVSSPLIALSHLNRLDELCIGLWPLVEVDISGSNWNSSVIYTVCDANWAHFSLKVVSQLFRFVMW